MYIDRSVSWMLIGENSFYDNFRENSRYRNKWSIAIQCGKWRYNLVSQRGVTAFLIERNFVHRGASDFLFLSVRSPRQFPGIFRHTIVINEVCFDAILFPWPPWRITVPTFHGKKQTFAHTLCSALCRFLMCRSRGIIRLFCVLRDVITEQITTIQSLFRHFKHILWLLKIMNW